MTSGKAHELKGRVKEAAGALTGDDSLKGEGILEQIFGYLKQAVESVIDAVRNLFR